MIGLKGQKPSPLFRGRFGISQTQIITLFISILLPYEFYLLQLSFDELCDRPDGLCLLIFTGDRSITVAFLSAVVAELGMIAAFNAYNIFRIGDPVSG
jgi:hypothetical protein